MNRASAARIKAYKMIRTFFYLCSSCVHTSLNVFTRCVLIVLSVSIYQGFVLGEVFLNSYKLVYPPYLEGPLTKFHCYVVWVLGYIIRMIAVEVIFLFTFLCSVPTYYLNLVV